MLLRYNDRKKIGLVGSKSLLNEGEYFNPIIYLKNNRSVSTPFFSLECSIDGNPTTPWNSLSLKPQESHSFSLNETNAKRVMGIGKHVLICTIEKQVIGKMEWIINP